jgi:hypothetical protein
MDPDQDIYCSKEPSVVHGSQLAGDARHGRPHSGPRALYWLSFLRCGYAGRSPAQPVIGNALNRPVSRCSAPMSPAGSARGGGGKAGCPPRLDLRLLSTHSTIACADGSRDNPTTSRTLASSSGSLEDLKASVCQGLPSCSAHTRANRAVADSQLVGQQPT